MEEEDQFETTDIKKPAGKRGRFGMNWKSLLTVFVILGIGLMLLFTEGGQKFAGQALDFVKLNVGNFVSGLFAGGKWQVPFTQEQMPSGEQQLISYSGLKDSFYGQQYTVYNASLDSKGLCQARLKIENVMLKTESLECGISAEDMRGTFEYTIAGTVMFDGEVSNLIVDGSLYNSPTDVLKVSFELLPTEFTLVGLSQNKITIPSATGSINRITQQGSVKSTEELSSEQLEIGGFVGFIKLENSNIKLQGLAVSVKGTGPHSSFMW
jgi:hypothetical protein